MKNVLLLCSIFFFQSAQATTWQVGSTQTYTLPSQLVNLVDNFDTVLIDGGTYLNDASKWTKHHLVFIGLGTGNNRTILRFNGDIPNGKGIFVFELPGQSDDAYIENIVFFGAQVSNGNGGNGAGIRFQAKNLTIKNCKFQDCQNGILEGNGSVTGSIVTITDSEFENNGYQLPNDPTHSGYEHHIYINASTGFFTLRNCYLHHPRGQANSIKTRALASLIEYNLIDEGDTGYGSYELNIAQGGWTVVLGNIFIQGTSGANHSIVGYDAVTNPDQDFYFVNNTVINKYVGNVKLFNVSPSSGINTFRVYNNIYASVPGATNSFFSTNTPSVLDSMSNLFVGDYTTFPFVDAAANDFNLFSFASSAIDMGTYPGMTNGFSLTPDQMYVSYNLPLMNRYIFGFGVDIGAYEGPYFFGLTEEQKNDFLLFPNPTHGKISIKTESNIELIEVYTFDGRLISSFEKPTTDIFINSKGIFFIKIIDTNNKSSIEKIWVK